MASASSHTTSSNKWREIVLQFYPDALERTHTVPPVHFNRVPLTLDTVPGTSQQVLRQGALDAAGRLQPQPQPPPSPAPPSSQPQLPPPSSSPLQASPSTPAPPPPSPAPPSSQPQPPPPSSSPLQASPSTPAPPPPPPQPPQVMWPQEPQDKPANVQDSDLWDDRDQARVVRNLEELGRRRQEKMFILSQFNVGNYLNKSQYQVAVSQLPHPQQLNRPGAKFSSGEFDLLIIHRDHGILIGEVKSVGHNHADLKMTEAQSDAAVVKRVQKALKQLARLETVVKHVLSDFTPPLNVRAALFLPNVTRAQLQRVLTANPQLEQDICQRLGAADAKEAALLCCTKVDVSARDNWWEIPPPVVTKLTKWWKARMNLADPAMSDEKYLDIVARFVGPASSVTVYTCTSPRVEVRTESEALAELGSRLSCLVLTPQQWDLVTRQPPLMCLAGPPGTGKTVMLVLLGVNWVQSGRDTYVVSILPCSIAISKQIFEQVKKTAASTTSPTPIGKVRFRHFDLMDDSTALPRAVSELSAAALSGAGLIIDEVNFVNRSFWIRTYSLIDHLIRKVPGLHLWCASIYHNNKLPSGLQMEVLTRPLRSAPAIVREVRPVFDAGGIKMYSDRGIPAPGDGQRVRHLRHEGGAHTGRWPVHCEQCGKDVAAELRQLGVGVPGSRVAYRDVFIITRHSDLQDEEKNDVGVVTSPACGVVRGVRGAGMPVGVVGWNDYERDRARWERKQEDMALAAKDHITAVYWGCVSGLERKVVVWLPGRMEEGDELSSDEDLDVTDRMHIVTRCTTQLVILDVPP